MLRIRLWLLALVASMLLVPLACADGDPRTPLPEDAGTTTTQEPAKPPPTTDKPKPTNPNEAPVPVVTSVSPDKGLVGSVGPSIIITGNDFVSRTVIQLDGVPLATTFVSGTELRATLPTEKLAAIGTLRLSAGTSPPGGGASKEVLFQVENPVPQLTSLSPLSVIAGAGITYVDVNGAAFVQGAKTVFGTTDLPTTFVNQGKLTATVPASLLATSSSIPVKVVNPAPGGGASTTIAFTVANPSAHITGVNPSAAFVGSAQIALSVTGTGFVNGSKVSFNGTELSTTFTNGGKLDATVPANLLNAAGDFPVTVVNPPPGGGVSAPTVFRVQYPAPSATSLNPQNVPAGSAPTEITVTGVGFFLTSSITFDNAPTATTYVDGTHLKATLSAAQLANAGSIAVRVVNPAPGGGSSTALSFDVKNSVPVLDSLDPNSVVAGSPDRTITLNGSGFVASSSVKSNGIVVSSAYVSPTQLTAVVPANQLLYAGQVPITVTNPAPGGGTSATKNLTIGCDTSNVDVALGAIGSTTTLATNFATATPMSRWTDSGSCQTVTITTSNQQPGRYWIVQNTAGVPITLSAWAVCTADGLQDDAYLTFYRRPTLPASDIERLGCAFYVAEGLNGPGGYSSPELGQSGWCPGLTKANGGGLTLGVCEKAVVHIQPYSMTNTTYTPPPQIRLKAE